MASWYTGSIYRGIDYSPTWPTWVVGAQGTQTGDSDFANDAFQSFWSNQFTAAPNGDPSTPANNVSNYRDDLATIRGIGFDLVRLYNWDMARGTSTTVNTPLDHLNFLDYAASLGLKVVVPVSDWFLSDAQYAWAYAPSASNYDFSNAPSAIQNDFTLFVASITDPRTGMIHQAVHSISVGNEGDYGQGLGPPPVWQGGPNPTTTTTPSNFLYRTIWWIYNLHLQINGIPGNGPNNQPVINGPLPIVPLSATFSNGDQGGNEGSWFQCVVNGVTQNQATPNGCGLGSSFATAVPGLAATDVHYTGYYYNSMNVNQVTMTPPGYPNALGATLAAYDSGAAAWPGQKFNVPLLLMEVFTENRTQFSPSTAQATAAINQATTLEAYLKAKKAGTAGSTTNLMGYNYFEFNDEQQVKLNGLYGYGGSGQNANTGTTSVYYSPYSFPTMSFPVYPLSATVGPGGVGTLAADLQALFPVTQVSGLIVAAFGKAGDWRATFYTGSVLPSTITPGMTVVGPGIPTGTTVALVPTAGGHAPAMMVVMRNRSPFRNPFSVTTQTVKLGFIG